MKKPKKTRKTRHAYYDYIKVNTKYTPDDLIDIAKRMEKDGISEIELETDSDYYNCNLLCIGYRPETDEEMDKRYHKELSMYNKWKQRDIERKQKQLEKLAKELGVKICN